MRRSVALLALVAVAAVGCTVESQPGSPDDTTPENNDLLHENGVAARAVREIEKKLGSSPAQFTEVDIYDTYLIADAQDPRILDHIDRYTWRDGDGVDPPEPVQLSGPQEETAAQLFPSTAVDWSKIARYVRRAEQRALHARPIRIEDPRASYVFVERSTSSEDDGRITIRVSIDGPRRDGYVEMSASGEILSVEVS
jgi:hypothetical protein